MKILLSAIPFDNGKSGISVYIREVVKALESAGHELTLIVEDDAVKEFERFDLIRINICKYSSTLITTVSIHIEPPLL